MKLIQLLEKLNYTCIQGDLQSDITDLIYDSRKVTDGSCFLCISGTAVDAHTFIPSAIENGAAAIIVEKQVSVPEGITVVQVEDTRYALAMMSAAWFGHPAGRMTTIGITGTKGKTTTTNMIRLILEKAGHKVGTIGTLGAYIAGKQIKTKNTTPESYELQSLFCQMADAGCAYVIMEVSSQGLKLNRVAGIQFDYGIYLNLSEDHIAPGEHESFEEYRCCKSLLFQTCVHGLINRDDPHWQEILKNHTCTVETFGMTGESDLYATDRELTKGPGFLGNTFRIHGLADARIEVNMPGKFSTYNALAAIHVCCRLNIPMDCVQQGLREASVRGRAEVLPGPRDFSIIIDYAHNALSMENILTTLAEYKPGRMICLFGGGGNRARKRRYDMGEMSAKYADLTVLTTDNPRYEEVADINKDIQKGLAKYNGPYLEIDDRAEAIRYCIEHAKPDDMIVLIGKGHEEYQDIRGVKYPFSERQIVLDYYGIG